MKKINKSLSLNKISISSLLKITAGNSGNMSDETSTNMEEPPRRSLNCPSRSCSLNVGC